MRHKVNDLANVCTGQHSRAFRAEGQEPPPEITVPLYRLRLSVAEARVLAAALAEAVERAERERR